MKLSVVMPAYNETCYKVMVRKVVDRLDLQSAVYTIVRFYGWSPK